MVDTDHPKTEAPPAAPILNPGARMLLSELQAMHRDLVEEMRQLGESRHEHPGFFDIWPGALIPTTQRIRMTTVNISAIAPVNIGLRVGSAIMWRFAIGAIGTETYDVPYIIQRGSNVELVDLTTGLVPTAAELLGAWIVGFTE